MNIGWGGYGDNNAKHCTNQFIESPTHKTSYLIPQITVPGISIPFLQMSKLRKSKLFVLFYFLNW